MKAKFETVIYSRLKFLNYFAKRSLLWELEGALPSFKILAILILRILIILANAPGTIPGLSGAVGLSDRLSIPSRGDIKCVLVFVFLLFLISFYNKQIPKSTPCHPKTSPGS
jgi:hypothetical protein